jgi:hypothetical protein
MGSWIMQSEMRDPCRLAIFNRAIVFQSISLHKKIFRGPICGCIDNYNEMSAPECIKKFCEYLALIQEKES